MLETLGSFTIGFFAGIGIFYYILTKINERRSKAAAAINKVAEQIGNEQNKENEQKVNRVIINVVDGGPSALLPLHGQKAKIIHANVMLYCQIEGINDVIAVPASCVVPDKTSITP